MTDAGYFYCPYVPLDMPKRALDRVSVNRMLMLIKRQVGSMMNHLVFEDNDDQLRESLKNSVSELLQDYTERRGIDDFKVVCDATNNPPESVDKNILNVSVYIKKSVDFIPIDITIVPQSVEFGEFGETAEELAGPKDDVLPAYPYEWGPYYFGEPEADEPKKAVITRTLPTSRAPSLGPWTSHLNNNWLIGNE